MDTTEQTKQKTKTRAGVEERRKEEQQLLKALQEIRVGANWIESISNHLGWSEKFTHKVGRRLRRKGLFPTLNIKDQILNLVDSLEGEFAAYQLEKKLMIL